MYIPLRAQGKMGHGGPPVAQVESVPESAASAPTVNAHPRVHAHTVQYVAHRGFKRSRGIVKKFGTLPVVCTGCVGYCSQALAYGV